MISAGGLDTVRAMQRSTAIPWVSDDDLAAARGCATNSRTDDVLVYATNNNSAVAALGGRRVVSGYTGWTWDLGLPDWAIRWDRRDPGGRRRPPRRSSVTASTTWSWGRTNAAGSSVRRLLGPTAPGVRAGRAPHLPRDRLSGRPDDGWVRVRTLAVTVQLSGQCRAAERG